MLPAILYVCRRSTFALFISRFFWANNTFLKSVYYCSSFPVMLLSVSLATTPCQFHTIYHTGKNIKKNHKDGMLTSEKKIEILDSDSVENLKFAASSDPTRCRFLYDTHISEQPVPPSSEYSLIYPRDTNTSTFP